MVKRFTHCRYLRPASGRDHSLSQFDYNNVKKKEKGIQKRKKETVYIVASYDIPAGIQWAYIFYPRENKNIQYLLLYIHNSIVYLQLYLHIGPFIV